MFLTAYFIFLITVNVCFSSSFVHLFGYGVVADLLEFKNDTVVPDDCAADCVDAGIDCIGFQMFYTNASCLLLTRVRDYTDKPDECRFFLRNDATYKINGRNLSDIEQLVQNNGLNVFLGIFSNSVLVYASEGECPDGWDNTTIGCALATTKEFCSEYGSYLEMTYSSNDSVCYISTIIKSYSCPNSSWSLGVFSTGAYCYFIVPYNSCTYLTCSTLCTSETGGTIASIHSSAENSFVFSLRIINTKFVAFSFTVIGLVPVGQSFNYVWYDGTSTDYTNWDASQPFGTDSITLVGDGTWSVLSTAAAVTGVACKTTAQTVYTVT